MFDLNKGEINDVSQVWDALDQGKTVYWSNVGYKVYIEPVRAGCEFQETHFTRRGDDMLSIRFIDNYFGGVMDQKELNSLFTLKGV